MRILADRPIETRTTSELAGVGEALVAAALAAPCRLRRW